MSILLLFLIGASDTLYMTFSQALARASENAPEARLAGVSIEQQELESRKVLSSFLPHVTSQGQVMRLSEVTSFSFEPVPGYPIDVTLGDEYIQMLQTGIELPIWTFGRRYQGWLLSQEAVELARLDSLERCRQIRLTIAEIYASTWYLEQAKSLTSAALNNATRHRRNVEDKFEEGLVSHYQLLQARTREAELEPEIAELAFQQQNLETQLNIFLGVGEDTMLVMDFSGMDCGDSSLTDATAGEVLVSQPAWLQLELGKRMIDRQIKIKQRESLPALAASASYSAQRWPLTDGDWSTGWSYSLGIKAPLHSGYENYLEVARLEKEKVKLGIQSQALTAQVESDLLQARNDREIALARLKAAQAREAEAGELVRIVEARFAQGLASDIDLLDAELALHKARTDAAQTQRDLVLARERWFNLVGGY